MNKMRLAILGFGFISKKLIKSLYIKSKIIKDVDKDFKVVAISDSKGFIINKKGLNLESLIPIGNLSDYSKNYRKGNSIELLENDVTDLIVEATPTNVKDGEPGLSFIKYALSHGINVVTPNKGPLVIAFKTLKTLAEKTGSDFLFDGTVAGALPIFSYVKECLQGDKINKISGILNGTTNYILSKMYFDETSFDLSLKEAQERGFTEKDSSYDVDGVDAACKLVIMANVIMMRETTFSEVERVGIRRITQEAVSLAKKNNYTIKLVGTIDKNLEVAPKLVPTNHPLCVHGILNAIHLETDLAKEITLVGRGAGKETVSAVMNNLITILKKKAH
jgi:homoserine dehydrogenase